MMPKNIDRYQIQEEIGRGGMATVLKGYDPRFRRDIAIKLLPREFLHDPEFRARFQREAQTIAALEHPAIVPVYDFGEADEQLYLVMRLMNGGSLADKLEKGPLSITETARIVERLAPALDSAHALGIIHRDLKPSNILFDQWDNPYLADFGIVKLIAGSSTALTATGGLVGTPAYMSPEQVRGVDELDGRSDIYAMGIILFQMLTGKLPYNANTPIGLAFMHVTEPVPNIVEANDSLPYACQSVIDKAMAKDRDTRPATATAFSDTISTLAAQAKAAEPGGIETIVEPLPEETPPDLDEPEQAKTVAPETPPAPKPLLEPLETEVWPDEREPDEPEPTPQEGYSMPQELAALPEPIPQPKTNPLRRMPNWAWVILGVAFVIASLSLDSWFSVRDKHVVINTRIRANDGAVMVYVPVGEFMMGSEDGDDDEKPVHSVYLDSYWIDQTEVTNEQFAQFVAETNYTTTAEEEGSGRVFDEDRWHSVEGVNWQNPKVPNSNLDGLIRHPVVQVSWYDAKAYCEWAGGRLPTEAEWEKAAQWDEENQNARTYPWGNRFDGTRVNFCDRNCPFKWKDDTANDGYGEIAPVGHYPDGASPYGALDMAGNVWEWVHDWYDSDYYQRSPNKNPQGANKSDSRVLRGGSWGDNDNLIHATARFNLAPSFRVNSLGFRCAQE